VGIGNWIRKQWEQIRGDAKWWVLTNFSVVWGFVMWVGAGIWAWSLALPTPAVFCLALGVAAFSIAIANGIREWLQSRNKQEQTETIPPQFFKFSWPRTLFLLVLGVMGLSLYLPITDDNKQSVASNPDNSVSQTSRFKIRLDNIYFSTGVGVGQNLLALVVAVQNIGAPSPATEWKLTVKVGKREYTGQPFTHLDIIGWHHSPVNASVSSMKIALHKRPQPPSPLIILSMEC
jgi:hypothetical protein